MSHPEPFCFVENALPYGRTGVQIEIRVNRVLYDEPSEFGQVQVFDTEFFGRMLVIDGIVQTSLLDEFIYHEMLALTPLLRHDHPKRVLIVGGGDGGAARQALRMRPVESVVQVEIDPRVVQVCRKHLPEISGGAFEDPRCRLVIDDGARFVARTRERFDVLILDLTDPLPNSPAETLFEPEFLRACKQALAPGGVLSMQCGSLTFQPDEVATMVRRLRSVFPHVTLHHAVVPSYQLTSFGFLIGSEQPPPCQERVAQRFSQIDGPCRYLSPEIYRASQALPPYLGQIVG